MSGKLEKKNCVRMVWSMEMENVLLDHWEEKIEELRGARKNSHVFQEIAAAMQQNGFSGSWMDVRSKVDNLTRKYKQEKNKIGPTGGTPSRWCHYNKVHNILGSYKQHNIEGAMHESTDMSTLLDDTIEFVTEPSTSTAAKRLHSLDDELHATKKRKGDNGSELVKIAKERIELQRQQHEEKKAQLNEMFKRLDTISAQNASFQKELLNILREKNK